MDYWGAKGYVGPPPPLRLLGSLPPSPSLPTPMIRQAGLKRDLDDIPLNCSNKFDGPPIKSSIGSKCVTYQGRTFEITSTLSTDSNMSFEMAAMGKISFSENKCFFLTGKGDKLTSLSIHLSHSCDDLPECKHK